MIAAAATSRKVLMLAGLACLVSLAVMLLITGFHLFRPLDSLNYDLLMRIRAKGPRKAAETGIVLVTIDEESMAEIKQQWPWDRALYAKLIDRLFAAGVKAVGIDLLLIEPSRNPASDAKLAESLKKHPKVVLAAKLEGIKRTFLDKENPDEDVAAEGERLVLPNPSFRKHAGRGVVNLELGSGAVVRGFYPYYNFWDDLYPSFAVAVYEKAFDCKPALPEKPNPGIDFYGKSATFPVVPAYLILGGMIDMKKFKDKIVLIGVTFVDAHDLFSTPLTRAGEACSGVEIQANILASLITSTYPGVVPWYMEMIIVGLVVLLSGYFVMFRSGQMLAASFSLIALLLVVLDIWLAKSYGTILYLSYPVLAMPVTFILVSFPTRRPLVLHTKVGPYRLLEEIGRGGMAVVYRAIHPRTGEEVALKQMLPEYTSDTESVTRFLREIELIRAMNHPNIIRVVDAGEVDGHPYYAMEYIKGSSLDKVLEEHGPIEELEVRRIGGAVARAIARAHEVGVIHRDIKPDNIMLTATGMPKLTDFGVARKLNAPQLTRTGACVGTPYYIAPELCRGGMPSPASDIYSFGSTLYMLLAYRPPFLSDDMEALFGMLLSQPAPDIKIYRPGLDQNLADLIMECLNKRPEDRPESMMAVAKRLDPFYTNIELKTVSRKRESEVFSSVDMPEKTITIDTVKKESPPVKPPNATIAPKTPAMVIREVGEEAPKPKVPKIKSDAAKSVRPKPKLPDGGETWNSKAKPQAPKITAGSTENNKPKLPKIRTETPNTSKPRAPKLK